MLADHVEVWLQWKMAQQVSMNTGLTDSRVKSDVGVDFHSILIPLLEICPHPNLI